jgi:hypothetical protein
MGGDELMVDAGDLLIVGAVVAATVGVSEAVSRLGQAAQSGGGSDRTVINIPENFGNTNQPMPTPSSARSDVASFGDENDVAPIVPVPSNARSDVSNFGGYSFGE